MSPSPTDTTIALEEAAAFNEYLLLALWGELTVSDDHGEWEQY